MGSTILAVIMKCLILLVIVSSAMGDADPSADPQYPYGAGLLPQQYGAGLLPQQYGAALLPQHYGAGLLPQQYGAAAGLPYNLPPQLIRAGVEAEDTPASTVRLVPAPVAAPAPYSDYGHGLPYGYGGLQGYPGYGGFGHLANPGYGHLASPGYAGYAYPGAYRGWPHAKHSAAAAVAGKKA